MHLNLATVVAALCGLIGLSQTAAAPRGGTLVLQVRRNGELAIVLLR